MKKPNKNTILNTLTLDEILDLAKQKAALDIQEQLSATQKRLETISSVLKGGKVSTSKTTRKRPGRTTKPKQSFRLTSGLPGFRAGPPGFLFPLIVFSPSPGFLPGSSVVEIVRTCSPQPGEFLGVSYSRADSLR